MLGRILVVDDHPAVRATIRMLLEWHSFQVCGEAKDGKEAIERVAELKPDIVLLDIKMPEMDGLKAAREIQRIAPSMKIVFFTVYDSPQLVSAMRVFSSDFVPKSAAGTKLIPTLNRLAGISGAQSS